VTDQTAAEVDADTVANRAAQVISSMGADIRTLRRERDRYRNAWRSARERAQAYGEGILRVVKDREAYQGWLRQAEEAAARAAAPAVQAPDTDRAALRDRIAEAFDATYTTVDDFDAERAADAVLAVLPAPTDRAAVLREVEQHVRELARATFQPYYRSAYATLANDISRMADEAQPAQPWLSDSARIGRTLIWTWTDCGKGAFGEGYRAAQVEARALLTGQRGDAEAQQDGPR
jgi:hypothetical protein